MTKQPRIRPRAWLSRSIDAVPADAGRGRWWRPLSLSFRALRHRRTAPLFSASRGADTLLQTIVQTRHAHTHFYPRSRSTVAIANSDAAKPAIRPPAAPTPAVRDSARDGAPAPLRLCVQRESRLIERALAVESRTVNSERVRILDRLLRTAEHAAIRIRSATTLAYRLETRAAQSALAPAATAPAVDRVSDSRARLFSAASAETSSRAIRRDRPTARLHAPSERFLAPRPTTTKEHVDPVRFAYDALLRREPAPMVWRKSEAASGPAGARSEPAQPAEVRRTSGRDEPAPSQPGREPAPRPPVLKLDGPAIDRLAEDVIQRIDRRTRIDRERRGMS